MQQHGVPFHEKHKGQLFCDRSSQDLIDLLLQECQAGAAGGRVDHWQPCGLKALRFHDQADAHYEADTDRGTLRMQAVVVATGGLSIPQIGASDLGYRLARQFNLDMVPTRPALVPLTFDVTAWAPLAALAGLSLPVEIGLTMSGGATRVDRVQLDARTGHYAFPASTEPVAVALDPNVRLLYEGNLEKKR